MLWKILPAPLVIHRLQAIKRQAFNLQFNDYKKTAKDVKDKEEEVFYSDINGIRITSKRFYAGDNSYALEKIKKINLSRFTPKKRWGILLFLLGMVTILLGSFSLFGTYSAKFFNNFWIIDINVVSIAVGVIALLIAIIRMMIAPDEYSVVVETKNGQKEEVVSPNRKYAARLAASLKRAYYRQTARKKHSTDSILAI